MARGLRGFCAVLSTVASVATAQAQVREANAKPLAAAPITAAPIAGSAFAQPQAAPSAVFQKNQSQLPSFQEAQRRTKAPASATPADIQDVGRDEAPIRYETITVNKSKTMRAGFSFTDVLVGNPEIAEVVPISDRTLYVLGKKLGTTNVSIFDNTKKLLGIIDVTVEDDFRAQGLLAERQADIQEAELIARLRESGIAGLRARRSGPNVILSGLSPDAVTVDRAVNVLKDLGPVVNLTRVASPQQVMLKVRFVEINRRAGRDFGVRWEYANRSTGVRIGRTAIGESISTTQPRGVGLLTDTVPAISGAALNAAGAGQFFNLVSRLISTNSTQLDVFISALEEQGLARRLAEPNLVAMSGDRAEFLAGGEYPVPVAQSSAAVGIAPTITVQFKEFGVRLTFLPTVLANGLISLQLEPEVSEIDPAVSVSVGGGVVVPGLSKRRARTNVELKDGQSFSIAGLMQNFSSRNLEQVPWIGSIPIIGALFSSKEFQSRETELVVIVTPHLVKPAKPGQLMADPMSRSLPANDLDFFLDGKKELKRNMHEFTTANGVAVGPHGHMLPADFTDVAKVQGVVTPAAAE